MKFTNGYWMIKEGFKVNYPEECYDYKIENNALKMYLPYKTIKSRGDTLNIGMSTLTLTSPREDVIGVKVIHFDKNEQGPTFSIKNKKTDVTINDEKNLEFISGDLKAVIPKEGKFQIDFFGNSKLLTSSKSHAQAAFTDDLGVHYMREQLSLDPYEYVYGLGERFASFTKNGQTVDIWNEDGGTGSEQSYKNIPFYLTNKGYGVFVNHPEKVSFEIASENVSRTQFSVEGEMLEYFIIYGPTMKDILIKYTDLTGKPALPPAWSFGLWLSTSFTTDYSEKTVMQFIDGMQERDIPFNVFHFDCFWMKEFEWCGFEWNKDLFPDPKGLLTRIHNKGLKVCMWINPYIGQKAGVFEECKEKGYFIKDRNGEVWQWDMWQSGQGIIDFTNPDAREWYKKQLRNLINLGVDSFKTDFGERIPTDVVYFDGSDPQKMHNYYSYLYNEVVFELIEELKGKGNAVVFARSGSVGSQKFPVHWGGDNLSQYPSMAESLRGGLSFVLSGFGFWSHDIGGFEENTSNDLYKRWTQFGLLSTHSRYHGNIEYRVPWNFGEESVKVTQKFSKLKNRLMPYIYKEAVNTSISGIPMMRPMVLEFEEDYTVHTLDKQYMFGEDLLVAPIFNEHGEVSFYLPEGVWTNYLNNQTYNGGRWFKETHDYLSLPMLARENSIIIEGREENTAEYDYHEDIVVHVFELSKEKATIVYDSKGEYCGEITISPTENSFDVSVKDLDNVKIIFRNRKILGMEQHELGSVLSYSK